MEGLKLNSCTCCSRTKQFMNLHHAACTSTLHITFLGSGLRTETGVEAENSGLIRGSLSYINI